MRLLERFRSTPEWQSDDPLVRATAVRELPEAEDTLDLLTEIARTDPHPAVRCQAVARIGDVDTLVSILSEEADADVRLEAAAGIRDLVIDAEDGEPALRGVRALVEERDLVAVAREARLDEVGRLALSRLDSPRALGLVARRALRSEMAREALTRVDDPAELQAVAVKTEDRAIAVAAFERLVSHDVAPDVLEQVAKRARQKAVQRRARAMLSPDPLPDDEATAAVATPDQLCAEIEAIQADGDLDRGRRALDRVVVRWSDLETVPGEDLARRFTAGREAAEAHLAALDAARTEERQEDARRGGDVERREALCERLEQLAGHEPEATLEEIRTEWAAVPGGEVSRDEPPSLAAVRRRFERALVAHESRRTQQGRAAQTLTDLDAVLGDLQGLVDSGRVTGKTWSAVAKKWTAVADGVPDDPSDLDDEQRARWNTLQQRRSMLETTRRQVRDQTRTEREREEQENLDRLEQRVKTVEGLVTSDKVTLAEAERQLRALRRIQGEPGVLPFKSRDAVLRKLKQAQAALAGRVRELRDFSDWQRWANLGIQEQLCGRMEALAQVPADDDATFLGRFQEIMAAWRQASDVPKDRGAELWTRFKTAHDAVQERHERCRAAAAAERGQNLERQRAIVEEAESLAESTDWLKTVQRITELQTEWKSIGSAPRKDQRALWNRFRAACNTFFTRRKADLSSRKQEWARNLELKEALCARIEALAETDDVAAATGEVKRAQAEWKTVGPVRRSRSDAIWQRFRAACDGVFERAHAGEREAAAERAKVREALCDEVEAWLASDGSEPADGKLADGVRDVMKRWREAPEVPQSVLRKLSTRLNKAIGQLVERQPDAFEGTELDPTRTLKRLEKLCERVEALEPTAAKESEPSLSPAELLASKWRDALASNTMGARVDEGAARRAALEDVRRAKQDLRRLGPTPGEKGSELTARFHAAWERVLRWAEPPRRASKSRPSKPSRAAEAPATPETT